MGLKRRGTARKQVLDLSEKSDSPRRSWQTKYQQICVEHNTQDGDSTDSAASLGTRKASSNNPLSGLIANYNSDSDVEEEETDAAGDMNSKVSDFLKEIQTIVPSGSSIIVPGQPLTTPGLGPEEVVNLRQQHDVITSVSAWQECFDETTGYIYYWNMETNAVTWETPHDYLPEPGGSVEIPPQPQTNVGPNWPTDAVPTPVLPPTPVPVPPPVQQPPLRNKAGRKIIQKPVPVSQINKMAKGRPKSDSEDEKIEMITSFGQSSEDESEEEIIPPTKKKKLLSLPTSVAHEVIGPQLQDPAMLRISTVQSEPIDDIPSCLSHQVDDLGPPGVEPEPLEENTAHKSSEMNVPELCHLETKEITKIDQFVSEQSEVSTQIPTAGTPAVSEDEDSLETDEVAILTQLRSQALVLKELGGDLPDEVRELIEPVEIKPEDEPTDFDKELEQMEKELMEMSKAAKKAAAVEAEAIVKPTRIETNHKPTSFSLIAGYGDDSDQEDDLEKPVPTEVTTPVIKRTFESLPTAPVKTLFPIFDEPIQIPPTIDVVPKCDGVEEPLSLSPEPTHSLLFKPPVKDFTISALRLDKSREPTPERDVVTVAPMIDTSMPVKAGKRKKRLDISTSADLVAKAAQAAIVANEPLPNVEEEMTTMESEEEKIAGVSFVKAVEEGREEKKEDKKPSIEETIALEKVDEEARKNVEDLAQLIIEKVKFLGEGKEPVSPVQVMAIQIEMLVSAWQKGALTQSYLSNWLGKTWDELRRLESAAAPDGWACQWDRTHKRYYYYNISSGDTRWEYPVTEDDLPDDEKPEEIPAEIPEETTEESITDIVGGEQAMEICTTPPPPSPSPPPRPKTPPPPDISSRASTPPPPPPPRISPFPSPKNANQKKGKNKKRRADGEVRSDDEKAMKTKKPTPPDLPPLPPLPPPLPPPPPPSELPPLPTSPPPPTPTPPPRLAYGEPLPPGVDPVELPYARPHPKEEQLLAIANQAMADEQMMAMMHPMQAYNMMPVYQQPMGVTMGAPMMDYGGVPYMMHTHMAVPAVIAKPPAKKHKAALHAALDSFYSDLATIAPQPVEEVTEVLTEITPIVPEPVVEVAEKPVADVPVPKKKKMKKAAAGSLGLKKKGVSSLVAKWQQVQQEVRRDYETLDDPSGDDSSQ